MSATGPNSPDPSKVTVSAAGRGVAISGDVNNSPVITGDIHLTTVIYQGTPVNIPSLDAVHRHRAALKGRLEQEACARWGGMAAYIQEEGVTLPLEASPYQTGSLGPPQDLQRTLQSADRLLVLGEPGSGKTVALQRLAWELCAAPEPAIAVLIELFKYAGAPLAEVILAGLCEQGYLQLTSDVLEPFLLAPETPRCVFLFDGLNEVAPPYRDRLVEQLALWFRRYPRHAAILTSRSQDPLWRLLRDEVAQVVLIQPIRDEQARTYLAAHLPEHGAALYEGLDERLRALARTPFLLWLIKEAGQHGPVTPGSRAELYSNFVNRMLERKDWYTGRAVNAEDTNAPEWADPKLLQTALTHLAYHLGLKQARTCNREEAVEAVAQGCSPTQAKRLVDTCARTGLLAGKESVWFAPHQTVQEYFAARALLSIAQQEQQAGPLPQLARRARWLVGRKDGLAALAASDWWMETFVQLAGLAEDPAWLAREVGRANPWLAWWCVQEGQAVDDDTLAWIEQRSARLLQSPRLADRRRAVQALAQMKNERVGPPLLRAVADADPEVSRLAVQGLVELGEAARPLVEAALRGNDEQLWLAALRYLRLLPDDLLWLEIPEQMWDRLLEVEDRRLAVAAMSREKSERLMPRLLRAAADDDAEVFRLAVQGLVELGEAVRPLVEVALHGEDQALWRAALRYLLVHQDDSTWAELLEKAWLKVLGQPITWVAPGAFQMGSDEARDPDAYEAELPQHELSLLGYWIGRSPVTVAQFRVFVDTSGQKPGEEKALKGPNDHPVMYVSWREAQAYCRWLSEKTGQTVRLPSEAEWEKAARGTDGRIYPWGNGWDASRCNTSEGGVGGRTPVGMYSPQGDSPYGCTDMVGNVWEWTSTKWGTSYPYKPDDGREDPQGDDARVLRGGAFYYLRRSARCAARRYSDPDSRIVNIGFRVVCSHSQNLNP